jgi:hypothetical protein
VGDTDTRVLIGAIEVKRVPGGWQLWRYMSPDHKQWIGKNIYTRHIDALNAAKRLDMQQEAGKEE